MCDLRFTIYAAVVLAAAAVTRGADSYPTDRRTISPGNIWTNVGSVVDPDTVTSIFVVMGTSSTAAQINTQLNNCPSNSIVLLTNGTFNSLGGDIVIAKNGVVLRGMTNASGFPITILSGGKIRMGRVLWPDPSVDTISSINISSGLTEGSASITLASSANADFAAGDLFAIDQLDDGTNVKASTLGWAHRSGRSYITLFRCTSKSGSTIGFDPPLVGRYWNASQDPEAWGWSSYLGATLVGAGVEDLEFSGSTSYYMVEAGPAYGCWIRNLKIPVGSSSDGSARIRLAYCSRMTVTKNILSDTPPGSTSCYAVYPTIASFCEIAHNIITNFGAGLPSVSLAGSFIGYNACLGPFPYSPDQTFLSEFIFPHGGHDHDNLIEGNWIGADFYADAIFAGNSGNSGIVRNRIKGWYTGKTSNLTPVVLEAAMVNYTILGNVLGAEEYHTAYSQIYSIDGTASGTIRTNNYNTVNHGVNSAETQAGGNSTANSYRYASKPALWGDTECPWPSFDPAVTSGTNTLSYTNIPAGYRSYFGVWPDGAGGGGGGGGTSHNQKRAAQSSGGGRRR